MSSSGKFTEMQFDHASDFLDGLSKFQSDYAPPDYRSPWVFRGHNDAGWELKPSAWREDGLKKLAPLKKWLEPQVNKYASGHRVVSDRLMTKWVQDAAEIFAVRQFCDLADELGLVIDHADEVPGLEGAIESAVHGGRYEGWGVINTDHDAFVDVPFAFAQHHGIPTRYLDWTRDPHVAAFFAVDGANGISRKPTDRVCVWAVRRDGLARDWVAWTTVPRGQHHYLHAQHGLFLRMLKPYGYLMSNGEWPALTAEGLTSTLEIRKLTLPIGEVGLARHELFARRFSRAHLMPTFDNVASVTRERWDWLP